jgi:uncharacterized membrane protein YidH (DUF202 family)
MKKEQDYIQDIAEIRSMMERSSKFLSLSGWAGIMAGIYALLGAYIAYTFLNFHPDELFYSSLGSSSSSLPEVILLAITILILALGTAVFLSYKRAGRRNEKLWNPTAKLLLVNMMVPLVAGGILILFMISKGLIGLVAPFSLLFYGLALFNAGRYTYQEVKILGLTEIILGLIGSWLVEYGILFWALGFGVVHIIYGIHMNYKYKR